jgi:hypothetical protein
MRTLLLISLSIALTFGAVTAMRHVMTDRLGRLGYHLMYVGGLMFTGALLSYGDKPLEFDWVQLVGYVVMVGGGWLGLRRKIHLDRLAYEAGTLKPFE